MVTERHRLLKLVYSKLFSNPPADANTREQTAEGRYCSIFWFLEIKRIKEAAEAPHSI